MKPRTGIASTREAATAEILRVIRTSPANLPIVFGTIARNASRLCGGHHAIVVRFDGELMHLAAQVNARPGMVANVEAHFPRRPGRGSGCGRAILDAAPAQIPDAYDDPQYEVHLAREAGFRSYLAVPLLRDGAPIGAIGVSRASPGRFAERDIELLRTFADQAVIAIENARLLGELGAKNRELTTAFERQTATSEILRVMSSSPADVQPVFTAIARSAVRLTGAVRASVYEFDGSLIHLRVLEPPDPLHGDELTRNFPRPPALDFAAGRVVLERAVLHRADLWNDPDTPELTREWARRLEIRSVLWVPMLRDGEPIGVIGAVRREPGFFSDEQVALLQTFADQAVIAIQNARLFEELQQKNRALTRAHADVTEALDRQTATAEILRVISRSPTDVQPVFDTIVRNAVVLCDALFGAVFRFDGRLVHLVAHHNFTPEVLALVSQVYPMPPNRDQATGRAITSGALVELHDALADPEYRHEIAVRGGWRSMLAVPMSRDGTTVGAIWVARAFPGPFPEHQITLLQTFADQAVIAIENVRLFNELDARNRELVEALGQQTATSQILSVISSSPTDVAPVFRTILENTNRLCEASFSVLWLWDGEALTAAAHANVSPALAEHLRTARVRPEGKSTVALTLREHAMVHVPDILADSRFVASDVPSYRIEGARSILSVPMLREGRLVGVINTWRKEPRAFTDKQIELLKTFADQAVIAIENARLFNELEARTRDLARSVGQLTALGEVGRAVSSTLDLETVLTTIVSRAVELSGLDGGVVFEYDERTEEFVHRAATETGGTLAEARRATRIPKGEGVVGRAAVTLEPVQVPDITVPGAYASRLRENLIESGIRAILVVPMIREGRLLGALVVSRNRPGQFPAETIELLRTFGAQSALAIQNARLYRELEQKSRELEAASRHKSEFLANMSHELRTPLNAIIGFSEALSERMFGELTEKQDEYLTDIHASGQHLLSLINDILDLSKVEAGRMELDLSEFSLPAALESALMLVRERAGRRGIALHLAIDAGVGEIRADERKIRQVVLNLLSNAIKFTPEGGRIDVRAAPRDGAVEVSVADTGVGIAPEDQAAVFEEFRQVGTAARKVEGTGLGLALARKFVELHSGQIRVQSELHVGSTFTFTLPVTPEPRTGTRPDEIAA